jgi:hypothetical protein
LIQRGLQLADRAADDQDRRCSLARLQRQRVDEAGHAPAIADAEWRRRGRFRPRACRDSGEGRVGEGLSRRLGDRAVRRDDRPLDRDPLLGLGRQVARPKADLAVDVVDAAGNRVGLGDENVGRGAGLRPREGEIERDVGHHDGDSEDGREGERQPDASAGEHPAH